MAQMDVTCEVEPIKIYERVFIKQGGLRWVAPWLYVSCICILYGRKKI